LTDVILIIDLMFPFFGRKKNEEEEDHPHHDDKKQRPLDDLQSDLTVLDKDDMAKLEGGKTGTRSFPDILGWSSSLGETIPQ
jgi:hypothetical protein